MNIAIIGTGAIGSGLAQAFAKTKHGVVVADRNGGTELATKLKEQGLIVQASDVANAVAQSDVVILAVPYNAISGLARQADFAGKTVVDLSNPVKEDFSGIQLGFETSAAEEIAQLLSGATVVKAFNTVFAQLYPEGLNINGTKVQTFVASDDDDAKATVIALANDAGFDARNAGALKSARYLEPLGYMNIQFGYMLDQGTQIAPVWLAR